MRPILPALAVAVLLAAGCGEEERRARVSVLPGGDDAETHGPRPLPGPLGVSPDGRAVLLGTDTLFTAERLSGRGPGGIGVDSARFLNVAFSPDSTLLAFTTAGQAIGLWSRTAQIARLVDAFPGGGADSVAWAPEGRWLAWAGRSSEGISRVAVSDRAGRRLRQPVLEWLSRQGRSAILAGWIDPARLRVLVLSDSGAAGSLPYVWDVRGNHFTLEAHLEPLIQRAPGAPPGPGGVFSLDLAGDDAPETVALFRSADRAPAALVLESRGGDYRARVTDPLIEPADLGLESWEEGSGTIRLYSPARLASGTALLITLPSARPGLAAVGLFRVAAGGRMEPFLAATPQGDRLAIFFDGEPGAESYQLGIVDLDRDGVAELVSANGRIAGGAESRSVRWSATVFRERNGRLEAAPELESAALERIAEATAR